MELNFNPKVSIVIPVYNGSNFLREAIDSAISQTYKNIEIIVVNDGSTDNGETERIALSYGNKIRYFSKVNGGTSSALNVGINHMSGDYFSWLSHDDLYFPKKIERQIQELNKLQNKNTIIMTDLQGINENRKIIYKTNYIEHINKYPPRINSYIHPIIYNQTHGCTLLIPKECFNKVGLFDEKEIVAQDFEFFYRAFSKFPHKLISEILVTARESSTRQGKRRRELCIIEYSNLFISIIDRLSDAEIKLLAPDKISFYYDMQEFFSVCGYTIALEYINKKIIRNLQISSYDLIGNKFNGHDLHFYLRQEGIDSKQIVLFKESKDKFTFKFNFEEKYSSKELLRQDLFLDSDIVHLHLIHNIFDINYLPLFCRLKPTVITLHDPYFLAGHCVHHFDCTKWETHCFDCPYLNELFPLQSDYSALNFELLSQAVQNSNISAIVASKWLENQVRQSPIWKDKKIYYLPFGINQEIFKPVDINQIRKELGLPQKDIIIFFRSDSSSFKGLEIIKKSLSKLENVNNITLIIVGQIGLLREFNKKFNIIEYGWIKDDKLLSKLYQACNLFLMPSLQETFGMMAIEAMSCGKMVLAIAGEGTALPETINSPECGLAIKEENYAAELERLLEKPDEILDRGNKSLEYALTNYSKEKYISGLLLIYKDVIANHKKDNNSELVLEQLKKYSTNSLKSKLGNNYRPEDASWFFGLLFDIKISLLKLFRKMPINFQRFVEPKLRNLYDFLLQLLQKKDI